MKANTQRYISILFNLLFLLLLAGCDQLLDELPFLGSPPEEAAPSATITPVPTVVSPEETATQLALNEEEHQIILWLPPAFDPENGTPAGIILKQQLDTFTAEYPDTTITVRIKAPTGPGGMLDSLSTASLAAPRVLPGIMIFSRQEFEKAAREGLLMPVDTVDFVPDAAPFLPYAEEITMVKGTRYGFAFAGDALCMAYKPLQVAYPPTRWLELNQPGAKVMAFPAADPQGLMELLFYMSREGGFDREDTRISLDEEPLQKSLQQLYEIANANAFPYWLIDYATFDQSWTALKNSNAAFAVTWTSLYLAELPENISITNLPSNGEEPFTLADGWVLAFPQTSLENFTRYQALAKYLLDAGFQGSWTEAAGLLPVSEKVLSGWKNTEVSGILLEVGKAAHALPENEVMSKVSPLFNQATIEMIRKQTTYIESSNKILKALSE